MSCLGLHWTNDLPGAMIQVNFLYLNPFVLLCLVSKSQLISRDIS
jgi:hypothetical protein